MTNFHHKDKSKLTAYKRILYSLGWYRFPMCERAARCKTEEHWITFIDDQGEWLPNEGRIPYMIPEWLRKLNVTLNDPNHYDAGTILER